MLAGKCPPIGTVPAVPAENDEDATQPGMGGRTNGNTDFNPIVVLGVLGALRKAGYVRL